MRRRDLLLGLLFLGTSLGWALGGGGCAPVERDFGARGGTSGGTRCEPGTEEACYEGPEGTTDLGLCRAGTRRCLDDGSGYGACEGQVLPAAEQCATPDDEDCDGASPLCSLAHLWSYGPGISGNNNIATGVAVGGDESLLVAGEMNGTMDFGEGLVVSAGLSDAFLMKLDAATGAVRWARVYGNADKQEDVVVAADAEGGAFLSMSFSGLLDVGGIPATSAGGRDVLVARVSAEGETAWVATAGDTDTQESAAIAAMPGDSAVVGGTFFGSATFGSSALAVSDMTRDVFVAKIAGNGAWLWGAQGASSGYPEVNAVAVDGNGNVLVAGTFDGNFGFDGLTARSHGGYDAFLVKLDGETGEAQWQMTFGGNGNDKATGVAVDAAGNLVLVGAFSETVEFGSTTLTTPSQQSFFVARIDADGGVQSAAQFGAIFEGLNQMAVALDSKGNLALSGFYAGAMGFGGDTFMSVGMGFGMLDLFVAKLDPAGGHLASRGFGNEQIQVMRAVAVDEAGRIFTVGASLGAIDVGGGPVGPPDRAGTTPLVAAYSP